MGDHTEGKTTDTGMSSRPKWENPNHPLYLHHGDQPGIILVPQSLAEDNYSTWVQSMSMALTVKNKIGFVDGSIKEPTEDKLDEVQQWKRCNNLVKTWLLGSMSKDIASSVIHCKNANQMWVDLQEKFSHVNIVHLFHIENEIHGCVQGNMTPTRRIPLFFDMKATEISNGRISTQPEAAAFAVRNPNREYESEGKDLRCAKCNRTNHSTKNCRAHLKCTFCGWKGHTFDHCRKRMAALEPDQPNPSRGNQVTAYAQDNKMATPSFPFSEEECKQILQMLSKSRTSMANQVGNSSNHEELSGKAFSLVCNGKTNTWILDSGATDHMVCDPNLLTQSKKVENHTVELPNGSYASVTHIGQSIKPNKSISNQTQTSSLATEPWEITPKARQPTQACLQDPSGKIPTILSIPIMNSESKLESAMEYKGSSPSISCSEILARQPLASSFKVVDQSEHLPPYIRDERCRVLGKGTCCARGRRITLSAPYLRLGCQPQWADSPALVSWASSPHGLEVQKGWLGFQP
uniref:Uncharacterized protein n=1 Tax=Salix viminalis TaxID=40686 RepID=A0A6N2N5W9_SALVM